MLQQIRQSKTGVGWHEDLQALCEGECKSKQLLLGCRWEV